MAGMTQKRALRDLLSLWSLENRIYGIYKRATKGKILKMRVTNKNE